MKRHCIMNLTTKRMMFETYDNQEDAIEFAKLLHEANPKQEYLLFSVELP
jgi:hypothetical protein